MHEHKLWINNEPVEASSGEWMRIIDPATGLPDGLSQGEFSQPFFIKTVYGPGDALATLQDTGEYISEDVSSGLIAPGGGNDTDPVPEPGTLLLLGSGFLGAGGMHFLRRKLRKSRG